MLTTTFSPISTRPSSVADPRCGRSVTSGLGEADQLTGIGGFVFEDVEAGPRDLVGFEHAVRAVSSMISPRAVLTRMGLGAEQLQAACRKQVVGGRRVGTIDRNDIHAGDHLVERVPIGGFEVFLDVDREAAAVVVVDREAERPGGRARA